MALQELHVRGKVWIFIQPECREIAIHYERRPRLKYKLSGGLTSSSAFVANAGAGALILAEKAAFGMSLDDYVSEKVRKLLDDGCKPLVGTRAMRFPTKRDEVLARFGADLSREYSATLSRTATKNTKHVLTKSLPRTTIGSNRVPVDMLSRTMSKEEAWQAFARQFLTDWLFNAPTVRALQKIVIEKANAKAPNSSQLSIQIRTEALHGLDGVNIKYVQSSPHMHAH